MVVKKLDDRVKYILFEVLVFLQKIKTFEEGEIRFFQKIGFLDSPYA
jgi:hypothetical protein